VEDRVADRNTKKSGMLLLRIPLLILLALVLMVVIAVVIYSRS
jgi:hypothetical protein